MGLGADLARAGQRPRARYNPGMYRIVLIALVVVFAGLQYRLWIADGGWAEVHRLAGMQQELGEANDQRLARNEALQAEVDNLKSGQSATEGRARSDMGMIKSDERFFLTVTPPGSTRETRQAAR